MKVAHLITGLQASGAEGMLTRLVTADPNTDQKPIVISMMDEGQLGQRIVDAGIPLYCLNMQRGLPSPIAFSKTVMLLRRERPDVLMTWLYHADLLGLHAGRMAKIPRIYWNIRCSNMEMKDYSWLSSMLIPHLAKRSHIPSGIVVNSQAGRVAHETLGYRPKSWHLIPNGIDLETFHPASEQRDAIRSSLGFSGTEILVGNIARFDPMKDHKTLLRAWARVSAEKPNYRLVLVGRGIHQQNSALVREIEANQVADSVSLLGERNDIPEILRILDLVVLSSAYGEGFPNVLGEAMASGIPCIATDVGDSMRIIGDPKYIVPPRHPSILASTILNYLSKTTAEHTEQGRQVRQRAEQDFGMQSVTRKYQQLFATDSC